MNRKFLLLLIFFAIRLIQPVSGQIVGNHLRLCTYKAFSVSDDDTNCIQYEVRFLIKDGSNISNAPDGVWTKATPSSHLAIVDPYTRQKLAVRISNGAFEIARDANFNPIVKRSSSFSFVGWDGMAYDISYSDFTGNYREPVEKCHKIKANNSKCRGNACHVLSITSRTENDGGGWRFTNVTDCAVVLKFRPYFGAGCSSQSEFVIQPHSFLNWGIAKQAFCDPIEVNYK